MSGLSRWSVMALGASVALALAGAGLWAGGVRAQSDRPKRLVWRGWTKGWVSQDSYTDEAVKSAVQQILAKFPAN